MCIYPHHIIVSTHERERVRDREREEIQEEEEKLKGKIESLDFGPGNRNWAGFGFWVRSYLGLFLLLFMLF